MKMEPLGSFTLNTKAWLVNYLTNIDDCEIGMKKRNMYAIEYVCVNKRKMLKLTSSKEIFLLLLARCNETGTLILCWSVTKLVKEFWKSS